MMTRNSLSKETGGETRWMDTCWKLSVTAVDWWKWLWKQYSQEKSLSEKMFLALMRNGMGWECLKSASVQEARRTTLAEDSARQGLRQDSLIRWQGGIKEEIRLRWPCYRKNLMTGKKYRPGSAVEPGRKEEVGSKRSRGLRPVVLVRKRAFRRKAFLVLTEFRWQPWSIPGFPAGRTGPVRRF